jgi:hypothetical protein
MQRLFVYLTIVLLAAKAGAQTSADYAAYIIQYGELAMQEQQRTGIPAAIKMAQGLLESGAGKGSLVQRSNNHFGIKCKAEWTGAKAYHDDDAKAECFRAYPSPEDSYADHSNYLRNSSRYAFLFELDINDYKGWAHGLRKAGYATNPRYPQLLIKVIEDNHLADLTHWASAQNWQNTDWAASFTANGKYNPSPNSVPVSKIAVVQTTPQNSQLQQTQDDTRLVNYPEAAFEINACKVVWAKAGTSLLALATTHQITVNELLFFNDMQEQPLLGEDQLVYLERKKKRGEQPFYEAKQGETLWMVSQTTGVRLDHLEFWNKTSAKKQLKPGTRIYLQGPAPAPAANKR